MGSSKWDQKVPTLKNGSVVHYPTWYYEQQGLTWELNSVFQDTMFDFQFQRGRSAAYAEAKSASFPERKYVVFLSELEKMLPLMDHGRVAGRFTYCKRGQNYGTMLASKNLNQAPCGCLTGCKSPTCDK